MSTPLVINFHILISRHLILDDTTKVNLFTVKSITIIFICKLAEHEIVGQVGRILPAALINSSPISPITLEHGNHKGRRYTYYNQHQICLNVESTIESTAASFNLKGNTNISVANEGSALRSKFNDEGMT